LYLLCRIGGYNDYHKNDYGALTKGKGMNDKIKLALALATILICMALGAGLQRIAHRCPVCPKCPEFVSRSHIERDSVILHDTVRIVKYAPSIQVRTVPAVPTDARTTDSVIVYEVIDTMPDQAIIGFAISSCELPNLYLPDLTHVAWYIARPDRIRIISDTLTVQLPPLQCPSRFWRDVKIGGVCVGVGAIAATSYFYFR
jgi:hypothetical protein